MWFYSDDSSKYPQQDATGPLENEDSAGYADTIGDFVAALAFGVTLGALFFIVAVLAGVRIPGLIG